MLLQRGQKLKLADLTGKNQLQVGLSVSNPNGLSVDMSCFGVDGNNKLSDDRYFIFYNQKTSPCGSLTSLGQKDGDQEQFQIDLAHLPPTVRTLVFVITIDGNGTMSQIRDGYLRLLDQHTELARFTFSSADFKDEKAIMVGEIYFKEVWRFAAVGQGFNGGLSALLNYFGGEEVVEKVAENKAVAAPPPPKVSLSKITLEKRGDKISLEKPKDAGGYGRIVCNLNWTSGNKQKKGLFGGVSSKGIDLDLGCLYEMANGSKLVVQALGNCFGSYDNAPYIHLAGDDRTGASSDGEFLYINGNHINDIKRICVFAFIYEGVVNWAQADAFVTVTVPGHPVIEVRLDAQQNNLGMCAIAMIENDQGRLKLTKLSEYFKGHIDLDQRYNWGMRWAAGSK